MKTDIQLGFWGKLKKPIMTLAPMSGVTDEAFRLMFLKYGNPDVFWTEFIPAEGLFSKGREQCLKNLKFDPAERPMVAQIFGTDPVLFEKTASLIAELGFDGVDINMGCPDRDVEKRGAGAALMKNPALAGRIIRAVKRGAKDIPVSVKTRIGYSKNEIAEWIPALLKENISALIVHLRTRSELLGGSAHWELAGEIVNLKNNYAPETIVLGNGDIKSLAQARRLAKKTGIDGVMVGRGALGNPWFFSEHSPDVSERLSAIIDHAMIFESLYKRDGDEWEKHFNNIKKHFHTYAKGCRGARSLRDELMKVKNASETKKIVEDFLNKRGIPVSLTRV